MFFKIENEIFNSLNFQYYEYENEILDLYFNGKVAIKIKQSINEFNSFLDLLSENKNILHIDKIGINIKNISGISKDNENTVFYFVDGSARNINLKFSEIENKLLGE